MRKKRRKCQVEADLSLKHQQPWNSLAPCKKYKTPHWGVWDMKSWQHPKPFKRKCSTTAAEAAVSHCCEVFIGSQTQTKSKTCSHSQHTNIYRSVRFSLFYITSKANSPLFLYLLKTYWPDVNKISARLESPPNYFSVNFDRYLASNQTWVFPFPSDSSALNLNILTFH